MTKEKYNQLTPVQRYALEAYIRAGKNYSEIAQLMKVHKSTIGREIKRNTNKRGIGANIYNATKAQSKTAHRHYSKPKEIRFTDELKIQMLNWMTIEKYSPELVAAQWIKNGVVGVSHETIYKFIWEAKHSNKTKFRKYKTTYKLLKHGKRRRKRGNHKDTRGLIPGRVPMDQRSKLVDRRNRIGDVEVDLIMGAKHKSALLVMVDRATLVTKIEKLESKDSTVITTLIIKRLTELPQIKTITFDNDKAFCGHLEIAEKLGAKTFFTRPYTSQDKGTVENRNGVIRRFYPKKTDFNLVTKKEIKAVEKRLNNRPVRKFGYMTPNEVLLQKT